MHIKTTNIALGPKYEDKYNMLHTLAEALTEQDIYGRIPKELAANLGGFRLGTIDTIVKNGKGLSFTEAFAGMMHVVFATNNRIRHVFAPELGYDEAVAKGSYFLTLMATKEAFVGLTNEEVAGMVAAGLVDVAFFPKLESVFETSGMGADRGWGTKGLKTINASTLTGVVLASLGHTAMKHGSYGNTTKVGSTDVPEKLGANICQTTPTEIQQLLKKVGFWFNDAHAVKTLHYLSHLLMVETVNHVVGPMTPPVSRNTKLYKMMGVNHNVHPKIIAQAYTLLHKMGFVNLGGVVVLGGVDTKPSATNLEDEGWFRQHCYLDELSPTATVVSMACGDDFLGTQMLDNGKPFGVQIREQDIQIRNEIDILLQADEQALTGGPLAEYLACNVALALFIPQLEGGSASCDDLTNNFDIALKAIEGGRAMSTLNKYITATGGERVHWR